MLYQNRKIPEPHHKMPVHIKADYQEAGHILDSSSRGAAVLLRLCLEKLLQHFDIKGHLDSQIDQFIKHNPEDIQLHKLLEIVRVVTNNAVHSSSIETEIKNNPSIIHNIFICINMIVEEMTNKQELLMICKDMPNSIQQSIDKKISGHYKKKT